MKSFSEFIVNPVVRAQLEELTKYRQDAEEKELREAAKKYTIIGKKEEELFPVLKSLKAAGGTAYDDMIVVMDQAVDMVEKSGVYMMQQATSDKIKDSFGDIKLSMKEIKDIASDIVLGDKADAVSEFSRAVSTAEPSIQNLSNSVSNMRKLDWKASLGMEFNEADIQEYTAGVESLIKRSIASRHLEKVT